MVEEEEVRYWVRGWWRRREGCGEGKGVWMGRYDRCAILRTQMKEWP